MAGKKKGSLRQKRRAKEISEEFTEVTANVEKSKLIESKKDEELFVVDTVGTGKKDLSKSKKNKNKRRKKVNKNDDNDNDNEIDQEKDKETKEECLKKMKEEKRKKKKELPKLIGKKVKKIVETHQVDTIQNMMNAGRKKRNPNELRRATNKAKSTNFDLWEENNDKDVNNVNKAKKLVPVILSTSAPAGTAPVMLVPIEKNQQQKNNQKKKAILFITGNSTKMATDPTSSSSNTKLKNVQHKLNQKKKQVAVEICHPGQSYKPDEEHHQDAIGEALAIEIKRKEAIAYKEGPLGGTDGLSEKTLSVMIHSSDEEDDDDEDSSDDENTNTEATSTTFKKHQEKLTRVQRNKQKRHKQMLASHKLLKENKKLLSDIHPSNTKTILKKIRKHEEDLKEKKKVVTQLKLEKEKIPQGSNMYHKLMNEDPVRVPSLPVALTEDLNKDDNDTYGLRTVKPKGSLIQERLHSLIDRKMAGKRTYNRKNLVQGKKKKPGKLGNTMIW